MARFTTGGLKKPNFEKPGGFQLPGTPGMRPTDDSQGGGSDVPPTLPYYDFAPGQGSGGGSMFGGIPYPKGEGTPKGEEGLIDVPFDEGEEDHKPTEPYPGEKGTREPQEPQDPYPGEDDFQDIVPPPETGPEDGDGSNGDGSNGDGSNGDGYQTPEYEESDAVRQALAMLMEMMGQQPGAYSPGEAVQQALAMLQEMMGQKPGEYQSQWQDQMSELMDRILNREDFSYDLNGDALYQQYKDMYMLQGQQAMMDTMGQAAAMTGGYGNSYAQTVGQQTYQGYLQQLNDKVPELYQLALDKYHREGDEMYRQFGMLSDQDDRDYSRYRDGVQDWRSDMEMLLSQYYAERDFDYGMHRDNVGDWQAAIERLMNMYYNERDYDYGRYADERDFEYGKYHDEREYDYRSERDQKDDEKWQEEYDYRSERDQKDDEQWEREFEESKRRWDQEHPRDTADLHGGSSGGSGGGGRGSGGGGGGGYDTHGYTPEQIMEMQRAAGITADGIWGPETQAAYEAGYRPGGGGGGNKNGLSDAAQAWVDSLPYPSGGASGEQWKEYVLNSLRNSSLSDEDKEAIAYYLGL